MTEIVHCEHGSRRKLRADNHMAFLELLHPSTTSNYILRIKSYSVFSHLSNYYLFLDAWRLRQHSYCILSIVKIYMPIYVNSCAIFKG